MTTPEARRILIVEDEFLIAMHLEDMLSEMGHRVIASIEEVDYAMQFAGQADVDFAILDINLKGQKSFPVAEILRRRAIPFVFASGYGSAGLPNEFQNERTLQKPYKTLELKQAMEEAFARLSG